jgi:hypothetical protein
VEHHIFFKICKSIISMAIFQFANCLFTSCLSSTHLIQLILDVRSIQLALQRSTRENYRNPQKDRVVKSHCSRKNTFRFFSGLLYACLKSKTLPILRAFRHTAVVKVTKSTAKCLGGAKESQRHVDSFLC